MTDTNQKRTSPLPSWLQTLAQISRTFSAEDSFHEMTGALMQALDPAMVLIVRRTRPRGTEGDSGLQVLSCLTADSRPKAAAAEDIPLDRGALAAALRGEETVCSAGMTAQLPDTPAFQGFSAGIVLPVFAGIAQDGADGLLAIFFHDPPTDTSLDEVTNLQRILSVSVASAISRQQAETWLRRARYYAEEGMQNSPVAMLITNRGGRVMQGNRAFRDLSGHLPRDLLDWNVEFFFPDSEQSLVQECLDQLVSRQATHLCIETRVIDWQYEIVDVILDCYSLMGDDGHVRNIVFQFEDITEKKRTEQQVDKLLRSVELSPVATVITDRNALIEYVNPRFTELTGYTPAEAIGQRTNINSSGHTPEETYHSLWNTIREGREWQGELLNRRRDGTLYWARTIIFPIVDTRGQTTSYVSMQEDISEARRLSLQLEYEATHDQLTGLINRREFQRRLDRAIDEARVDRTRHSLCFIDLDRFKVINDTSGHVAGDELLRRISKELGRHVRANDTVARLGGDEFVLLLQHCSTDKALDLCEQIRSAIAELVFEWEEQLYNVGISAGIAVIDGEITDPVELLKQVDAACYAAKEAGKNRVVLYRDDDNLLQQQMRRSQWVPRLQQALKERRFQLHLQPIYPLQRPETAPHYEVLLRLQNRDGSLVAPGQFLPAAERYGMAPRIDQMVFDELFRFLSDHPAAAPPGSVFSINLSGASISEEGLLRHIITTIQRGQLPPERLQFEVTETAAVSSIREARRFMEQLRDTGCRVLLDDFGRGLSSFAYLKNLPVDILKIDGLFIREILDDYTDHTMVRMINELAHSLGMETIAEFIETEPVLDCIRTMGIDYGQGFHLARPDDMLTTLQRPNNQ